MAATYIEGETLEARLKKGALPLDQALQYATQIADALDKVHRAGIVHRELKPGNVVLAKIGAKLLDFGLAVSVAGAGGGSMLPTTTPSLTAHGAILGTFQYMGPGQLEGSEVDARSDERRVASAARRAQQEEISARLTVVVNAVLADPVNSSPVQLDIAHRNA